MNGECYFVFLIDKGGGKHRIFQTPKTIREIDERITSYESMEDLLLEISKNIPLPVRNEDIIDVRIVMKKPDGRFVSELYTLYKEDKAVLDKKEVMTMFNAKLHDKEYVDYFLTYCAKIPNFKASANLIKNLQHESNEFWNEMAILRGKLSETYKQCRFIYTTIKSYDLKKQEVNLDTDKKTNQIFSGKTSRNTYYKPSEKEILEGQLTYLKEYYRESLDIDDFDGYESISPFDIHRTK